MLKHLFEQRNEENQTHYTLVIFLVFAKKSI